LVGHAGAVLAIAWAPSGEGLVSAAVDGTVKFWKLEPVDRVSLGLATPDRAGLTDLDISVDRKWLAASALGGAVHVWDLQSLALVKTLPSLRADEITAIRWHPTKPWLAQTDKAGWMTVRSIPDGGLVDERRIDDSVIETARWLPNGQALVASVLGGPLAVWSPGSAEKVRYFERCPAEGTADPQPKECHAESVVGLAVEPRTNRLLSSDTYGNLFVWDIATRKRLFALPSSKAVIGENTSRGSISLSRDGRMAVTAGNSGKLIVYDLEQRRGSPSPDFGASQIDSAEFAADGTRIAFADRKARLQIWSPVDNQIFISVQVQAEGGPADTAAGRQQPPHLPKLAWVPELSSIAIASSAGEVRLVSYDVGAWRRRAQSVFQVHPRDDPARRNQ
jgi:WD40 repeat protein